MSDLQEAASSSRTRTFPFCSERCRLIDLGNWAAEKYVISTPIRPGSEDPAEDTDEE
jgi:uncharacterized protein